MAHPGFAFTQNSHGGLGSLHGSTVLSSQQESSHQATAAQTNLAATRAAAAERLAIRDRARQSHGLVAPGTSWDAGSGQYMTAAPARLSGVVTAEAARLRKGMMAASQASDVLMQRAAGSPARGPRRMDDRHLQSGAWMRPPSPGSAPRQRARHPSAAREGGVSQCVHADRAQPHSWQSETRALQRPHRIAASVARDQKALQARTLVPGSLLRDAQPTAWNSQRARPRVVHLPEDRAAGHRTGVHDQLRGSIHLASPGASARLQSTATAELASDLVKQPPLRPGCNDVHDRSRWQLARRAAEAAEADLISGGAPSRAIHSHASTAARGRVGGPKFGGDRPSVHRTQDMEVNLITGALQRRR